MSTPKQQLLSAIDNLFRCIQEALVTTLPPIVRHARNIACLYVEHIMQAPKTVEPAPEVAREPVDVENDRAVAIGIQKNIRQLGDLANAALKGKIQLPEQTNTFPVKTQGPTVQCVKDEDPAAPAVDSVSTTPTEPAAEQQTPASAADTTTPDAPIPCPSVKSYDTTKSVLHKNLLKDPRNVCGRMVSLLKEHDNSSAQWLSDQLFAQGISVSRSQLQALKDLAEKSRVDSGICRDVNAAVIGEALFSMLKKVLPHEKLYSVAGFYELPYKVTEMDRLHSRHYFQKMTKQA